MTDVRQTFLSTLLIGFACSLFISVSAHADVYGDPAVLKAAVAEVESGQYGSRAEVLVGPVLRKGAEGDMVGTVIRRLKQDGYLPRSTEVSSYTTEVMDAVRSFQKDRGLVEDGLVGPATSRAMNSTWRDRIEEIRNNLEEQRSFFSEAPDRFVLVNIPDAHLVYFENGQPSLEMKVIVGKEGWGTPTMEDTIEKIVVNPDWDVPASIVAADIAPKVVQDSDYLEKNNMIVLDGWGPDAERVDPRSIGWSSVTESGWNYHLRQLPGPDNPLGQVKISFPNDQAIYLHGTPNDHLFDRYKRGLSHGCIRMEEPLEMAGELLEYGTDDWDTARLKQTVGGEQQSISMERSVPVYLVYWTAFGDSSGELQLRPDLYDRM